MRRAPGSCLQHDPGARLIHDAKAWTPYQAPAEAKSTPGSPGRGFLCAILADPQTNARAGRNPSLKILPQTRSTWSVVALPCPDAASRSRPTTAPDASPSCARPSPAPPRRSKPDYTPGNGGSDRELLHNLFHHAGRGPADRTGGVCARGTQYHTGVPFAALPHDIAADPRLSPTDLRVLAALLYYARQDPSCYPSDASLAARVHRHPGTVRRCLKRLEDLGYIRREFVQATPANPTGRLIHLTCAEPDWPRPVSDTPERRCTPTPERRRTPTPERRRSPTPCADERTPRALAHTNREEPEGEERDVTIFPPIREQEQPLSYRTGLPVRTPGPEAAAPCPQQPPTDGPTMPQIVSSRTTPPTGPATPPGPPRPLKDEFRTLPSAAPDRVRSLAWRLAHHLRDTASVGFFVMVLSLVAAGSAPVERLMAAYVAADRSRGKAQKPGAIFVSVWSGWQPPLRPSEINRPVYYQADRGCDPVISSPAPPPGGDELSREEEIMTLCDILSRPHGPFARVARAQFGRVGGGSRPHLDPIPFNES